MACGSCGQKYNKQVQTFTTLGTRSKRGVIRSVKLEGPTKGKETSPTSTPVVGASGPATKQE